MAGGGGAAEGDPSAPLTMAAVNPLFGHGKGVLLSAGAAGGAGGGDGGGFPIGIGMVSLQQGRRETAAPIVGGGVRWSHERQTHR